MAKSVYQFDQFSDRNLKSRIILEDKICCQQKRLIDDVVYGIQSIDVKNEKRQIRYNCLHDSIFNKCSKLHSSYDGSPFIMEWFLLFTKGELKIKFNHIFPALIYGIQKESEQECETNLMNIINLLNQVKCNTIGYKEKRRIECLETACAQLYSMQTFLYKVANQTLRDNDRSKLVTLGPYCYLVYSYIGRSSNAYTSIRRRLQEKFKRKISLLTSSSLIVYRGTQISNKRLEEYRHAAGKKTSFKWSSFISTSLDEDVAQIYSQNVLYEVELNQYATIDLFRNLCLHSVFKDEKEILIRPGVRYRVKKVEDVKINKNVCYAKVYISIIPSYISILT